MARKKTLSDELTAIGPMTTSPSTIPTAKSRPANRSSSRVGSDRKKPKPFRLPGVQQNYESTTPRTNSKGESFITFTRPDKPGMTFNEYTDESGKRRVVGVKKRPPKKGLGSTPIGG